MYYIKLVIQSSVFNGIIKPEIKASVRCLDYSIYTHKKHSSEYVVSFRNKRDITRFMSLFSIIESVFRVEILNWNEFKEWLRM